MIEYDKLKIAHELAEKYHNITGDAIVIEHNCCYGCYVNVPCQFIINQIPTTFNSIKDMIQKLSELTQPNYPKPKYEVGQEVWALLGDNNPYKKQILTRNFDINPPVYGYCYDVFDLDGCTLPMYERELYSTREALIDAQIEHWSKLKLESMSPKFEGDIESFNEECIHESDGNAHAFKDGDTNWNIVMSKCKKCGKFYK